MKQLSQILTLLFIINSIGCGEPLHNETSEPWLINDGYTVEIKYGIYRSTIELIEDTCSPSLKSILDTTTLWPPPYSLLPVAPFGSEHFAFQPYNIRAGSSSNTIWLPSKDRHIRPLDSQKITNPEYSGIILNNFVRYCRGLNGNDYSNTLTLRSLSEEIFEIEIEDQWYGFTSCDHEEAMRRHAWFPRAACREKYKITYTLDEELPRTCRQVYVEGSELNTPVDPQNTAPYPEASYYPAFTKEDIIITCTDY